MALPSSSTITHEQIRNEFHQGFASAPLQPTVVTNDSIANYRAGTDRTDHWANNIPSSGSISYSNFHGKSGQTGQFKPGRDSSSYHYIYGWRANSVTGEVAGTFVDPEYSDSGANLGTNVLGGQRTRFAPYFYVGAILVENSYYYAASAFTKKVGIWGEYNASYNNTHAVPPNIQFKSSAYSTVTLSALNGGNHQDPFVPSSNHNTIAALNSSYRRYYAYRASGASTVFNMFEDAFNNNRVIYWRTY